jgi:C_GCAxxG_C_C family probable redox protein
MGRLQETCGAVTGAYMALGVFNAKKYSDNNERKLKSYAMIQEFEKKFIQKIGSTSCKALTNCDLRTEEGQKAFKEKNMHENICNKCVSCAVEILDEIMK